MQMRVSLYVYVHVCVCVCACLPVGMHVSCARYVVHSIAEAQFIKNERFWTTNATVPTVT